MSKEVFYVEFSNGADTVKGVAVPSASVAMEIFLDKYYHGWGDCPHGRIVDVLTGEVYAYYTADIDSDLNLTNNLWVSGEFNAILQMEEALGGLLDILLDGDE